ncbi:hypothetical protein QR680_013255 [Steinernema hermaphroditum]|uniref:ShKT domain-containing protein n=1 Tax=Steinernema hermaphroditum TaxID=289476 RepID=A0AA39I7P7_9BILA|nr:hypothetical protein QR680_013255 [Steinernema hermaphroditum]
METIALLLLVLLLRIGDAVAHPDISDFLVENREICGNPFANAQWTPVLDICEVQCHPDRELCVENDDLEQKCSKLPDACVKLWEVHRAALRRKVLRDDLLASEQLSVGGEKAFRGRFRGAPRGLWN